jgi:hypothetical protein
MLASSDRGEHQRRSNGHWIGRLLNTRGTDWFVRLLIVLFTSGIDISDVYDTLGG